MADVFHQHFVRPDTLKENRDFGLASAVSSLGRTDFLLFTTPFPLLSKEEAQPDLAV
jgi:hypothetical protein